MNDTGKRPIHDFDRKGIKKAAHSVVKKHYVLLLFICLLLAFIGVEYSESTTVFRSVQQEKTYTSDSGALFRIQAFATADEIVDGRLREGDAEARHRIKQYEKKDEGGVLSRRRGAFASVLNNVSSGYLSIQIARAIQKLSHSKDITVLLFGILMFFVYFGFWTFVKIPISAVTRRVFLEARTYDRVLPHTIVWIPSVHRWFRVSFSLLYKQILLILWWLTIIGGMIKIYSYSMVPYIVSENPDIRPREAVTLSRRMMDGHKWELFKLDLTLIPWTLLSVFTWGIAGIVYGVPYKIAVMTEYYAYIRECAKSDGIEGVERLNDEYLYKKADTELLRETYSDIHEAKAFVKENKVELTPVQRFFSKYIGIWIGDTAEKNRYQEVENRAFQVKSELDAVNGAAYPRRLHPLYNSNDIQSKYLEGIVSSLRCYTIWSLVMMFFIFAFVGWTWEVSLHIIMDGVIINRGTMHGPWLPIYGFGAVYILMFLHSFRKNVFAEFFGAIILSGFIEYMSSWVLEMTHGVRWWDYTGYFLNLNGRICGEGLLVFGLGGLMIVYIIAPLMDDQLSKIKTRQIAAASIILMMLFGVDSAYSINHPNKGKGISDYNAYKQTEMQRPRQDSKASA